MTKPKFLVFVLIIFLLKFLLLPVLEWEFPVEPFAVFAITLVLVGRKAEENFWLIITATVLFDIFSGGFFGSFTIALVSGVFLAFLVKKFLLVYAQNYLISFLSIFVLCELFRLVLIVVEKLSMGKIFEIYNTIYLVITILIFYSFVYVLEQKRISGVKF